MNQIENLIANYHRFVQLPWPMNLSGKQKVWFAVYPPAEERRLRTRVKEFEVATEESQHKWRLVDISNLPAEWIGEHRYKEAYFKQPAALATVEQNLKKRTVSLIQAACVAQDTDGNTVVAVLGAGSLFGFTHISAIVAELESDIRGRLLVFFPGEYERNQYRFMDAREGYNYMAVPITCAANQVAP